MLYGSAMGLPCVFVRLWVNVSVRSFCGTFSGLVFGCLCCVCVFTIIKLKDSLSAPLLRNIRLYLAKYSESQQQTVSKNPEKRQSMQKKKGKRKNMLSFVRHFVVFSRGRPAVPPAKRKDESRLHTFQPFSARPQTQRRHQRSVCRR